MKTLTATEYNQTPGKARTDQEVMITDRGRPTHVVVPYARWRAAVQPFVSAWDAMHPKDDLGMSNEEIDELFERIRSDDLSLPRVPDFA